MLSKVIILAFLAAILWCLISSFYFLVKDKGEGDRTVKRLTWRVSLSLVLFAMLYGAFLMGWVKPSSSGPIGQMPQAEQSGDG